MKDFNAFLSQFGYEASAPLDATHRITLVLSIFAVAAVVFIVCKRVFIPLAKRIAKKTANTWDDHLLNDRVLNAANYLIPTLIIYFFIPLAFYDRPVVLHIISKVCIVAMIALGMKLANAFISSFYKISYESDAMKKRPLKGLYQMLKIVVVCVGLILIFSVILDKNPEVLLAGLGASAAVLMLVFQDTIKGLVAGVQLDAYDMLRPGDWITMPGHGAHGIVTEVTLNFVKVRNWDNTIITIPTYQLVSESFQNWRGMWDAKGRRITEQIYIDVSTIHFCEAEELEEFERLVPNAPKADGRITNLHYFRYYLENHLRENEQVTPLPHLMVRLQPAASKGLPIEIYCFTRHTDWIPYEHFKAQVIEFAFASLHRFGLRAFQSPSGADISKFAQ